MSLTNRAPHRVPAGIVGARRPPMCLLSWMWPGRWRLAASRMTGSVGASRTHQALPGCPRVTRAASDLSPHRKGLNLLQGRLKWGGGGFRAVDPGADPEREGGLLKGCKEGREGQGPGGWGRHAGSTLCHVRENRRPPTCPPASHPRLSSCPRFLLMCAPGAGRGPRAAGDSAPLHRAPAEAPPRQRARGPAPAARRGLPVRRGEGGEIFHRALCPSFLRGAGRRAAGCRGAQAGLGMKRGGKLLRASEAAGALGQRRHQRAAPRGAGAWGLLPHPPTYRQGL